MSKLQILFLQITFFLPVLSFAEGRESVLLGDEVAYASIFAGDFSLLLSIIIGIVATFFVFRAAKKMGGGLFGSVLGYIGVGMAIVVLGTISIIFENWFSYVWFNVINTVCFALGYIFMVVGANKLLKGITST